MGNMLEDGAAWLGEQLQAHAGRTVNIRQGKQTVSGIVATLAMKEYKIAGVDGFETEVTSCDWTFVRADLDTAGLVFRTGAVIEETVAGVLKKYEAMELGDRPAAEDLDTSGILITLHTKQVR